MCRPRAADSWARSRESFHSETITSCPLCGYREEAERPLTQHLGTAGDRGPGQKEAVGGMRGLCRGHHTGVILPPGERARAGVAPGVWCPEVRVFPESPQDSPRCPETQPTRSGVPRVGNPSLRHEDEGVQADKSGSWSLEMRAVSFSRSLCLLSWKLDGRGPTFAGTRLCRGGTPLSAQSRGPGAALLRPQASPVKHQPPSSEYNVPSSSHVLGNIAVFCFVYRQPYKHLLLDREYCHHINCNLS